MNEEHAIGIDLGTTYSAVAVITPDGKPEVIPDEQGRPTTPSVIVFERGAPVVGYEAKERQSAGTDEVAAFFKRSMGDPHFLLTLSGRQFTPVDLSAIVLAHMKAQAEQALGRSVRRAVISVPAYFTHVERQATIQAARQAGIEPLSIISEPTAAALAYGLRPGATTQRVLVYDLGGGTFDCSIVEITPQALNVIGVGGDHSLGGKDWDDRLAQYLQTRFLGEFGVDPMAADFQGLLASAENLKRTLSARQSAEAHIQADGHSGAYQVTREEFEGMCHDLIARTEQLVELTLQETNLTWRDIDGVLPVGGSTRMPMVRASVERMSGKALMGGVNPDEAVALGAALQAAMDIERSSAHSQSLFALRERKAVHDVIAHSLGMIAESEDRSRYVNSVIIPKNLSIPSKQTRPYTMRMNRSGETTLDVYLTQGETTDPQDCVYLGRYVFTDIPQNLSGEIIVDITYEYDRNGVVHISAVERTTARPLTLTVEDVPADVPARFLGKPTQSGAREPAAIYLAFDVSGSMAGEPIEAARQAAERFVGECDLTSAAIGLISFSDDVHVDLEASHNGADIARAIARLRECSTGVGNAGQPFDQIYERLSQAPGQRYAIVLADGVWSNQSHAIQQARRCHNAGIEIVAIGFGGADRVFLEQIASSSEQSIFTGMNRLSDAFSGIAREITEGAGQELGASLRMLRD